MTSRTFDEALEHLSRTPGAEVILRVRNPQRRRIALGRLGDRAHELALDVRVYFGFAEVRRRDGYGRIRVLTPDDHHGYTPTLELDATDA